MPRKLTLGKKKLPYDTHIFKQLFERMKASNDMYPTLIENTKLNDIEFVLVHANFTSSIIRGHSFISGQSTADYISWF